MKFFVAQQFALCFSWPCWELHLHSRSKAILITKPISRSTRPIRGRKSSRANSLWDSRIKSAVDAQLAAKGWTQVDSGGDVAIVAIATSHTERTLQTFYDGMGGGWRWRGFGGMGEASTTEQDYKEGTLLVDLYDAKTKQLIWRGSAEDTVSNNAEKNEKNLNKGVAKMFKKFPPQAAKA